MDRVGGCCGEGKWVIWGGCVTEWVQYRFSIVVWKCQYLGVFVEGVGRVWV